MTSTYQKALDTTKIELMRTPKTIFYTAILFSLRQVWTDKIPTAAVDGKALFINESFFMALTLTERLGLVVHEIMHIALDHLTRVGSRTRSVWNEAADYIINNSAVKNGFKLPKGALINSAYASYNTEQLYEKLLQDYKDQAAAQGIPLEDVLPQIPGTGADIMAPATTKEKHEIEKHIADILVRASILAESAGEGIGHLPGEIELAVKKLTNPKLPWNVILQNHMSKYARDDYSMQRPNRRFLPDYYLPGTHSEAICNLVIAPDTSGSTTYNHQFSHFVREIKSIQETMHPEKITLINWDTQIYTPQDITAETDILNECKFHGGGGTNLGELIDWLIENKPEVAIIFTDGQFYMPTQRPVNTDILWIIHDDPNWKAPYGTVIHYEMEKMK